MKRKHIFMVLFVLVAAITAQTAKPNTFAGAAPLSESVVEYSSSGVVLPILHMSAGQSYMVEVFAEDDINFESALELEGGMILFASSLGRYKLRYLLNDNGVESYLYNSVVIKDTTVPEFSLSIKDSYAAGSDINLKPAISDNTAHMATVKYEILLNGKKYSKALTNGVIAAADSGEYKVKVTVTDGGGNSKYSVYNFSVTGGAGEKPNGDWVVWLLCGGGGLIIVVGAVFAVFIIKNNKKANKGGKND